MNIKETSSLRTTIFHISKIEINSIKEMSSKIKNLRRMPFHQVFLFFPYFLYNELFKMLEQNGVSVVSVREDTNKIIAMRVS